MFSASALAVPIKPEAQELHGYPHHPQFEPGSRVNHGQPCSFGDSSPREREESITLPVPFLEPESRQGPLAQEIRRNLIDEFTLTYPQLEGSVCNNYWTPTPPDPELSGSGAAYDQSSYHNRGGRGHVFVDPSGKRARSGCVNIHLPGEEIGELALPEGTKVRKRSLGAPPGAGYGGAGPFGGMGHGGQIHVAQPDFMGPPLGPIVAPYLDGYDNPRGFPGHKQPYHEPLPQGYTEQPPRPIIKHLWSESREPPAHNQMIAGFGPEANGVTVTHTVTVTITERPRNPPAKTVHVPVTITVDATKTITVSSVLPVGIVTTTEVAIPTDLPEKLSELDGRLAKLGYELKRLERGG
ncbi:hypothetical protein HOY82DRAFT_598941 [Tuber indicum]|nr:hypothetical protein HOY82DRAFT_598941 [Tuber indicum]